jgi:hypothetical protein
MFLIDDFDISRYENYDCAIVLQSRNNNKSNYFWNGLYYFDITKMQNKDKLKWDCCQDSDGYYLDVGGMMQEWLILQMGDTAFPTTEELRYSTKQYHTNQIYFIKHLWSNTWNFNEMPKKIKNKEIVNFITNDRRNRGNTFFCEIYDNTFLHYRAGGNWNKEGFSFHNKLTQQLYYSLMKTFELDQTSFIPVKN